MKAEGRKEVLQSDTKRLRIEGAVTCKDVFPLGCDQHRSIDLIEINEEAELGKRSHSHPIQLRLDLQIDLHLGKDTNFAHCTNTPPSTQPNRDCIRPTERT
jgi:hypothetical protein